VRASLATVKARLESAQVPIVATRGDGLAPVAPGADPAPGDAFGAGLAPGLVGAPADGRADGPALPSGLGDVCGTYGWVAVPLGVVGCGLAVFPARDVSRPAHARRATKANTRKATASRRRRQYTSGGSGPTVERIGKT
jgi:hypothetical protein